MTEQGAPTEEVPADPAPAADSPAESPRIPYTVELPGGITIRYGDNPDGGSTRWRTAEEIAADSAPAAPEPGE